MKPYKGYLLETILHTVETFSGPQMPPMKHQEWRSRAIRCSDGQVFDFNTEKEAMEFVDREGDESGRVRRIQELGREIASLESDLVCIQESIVLHQDSLKRRKEMLEEHKAELNTLQGAEDVQKTN